MMKEPSMNPFDDEVEHKIDRLNHAVQQLMIGIEISSRTPRNPSQLSFVHPDWMDEDDEDMIPESFERRFEEVLIQLDRLQMQVEDFRSAEVRKDDSLSFINEEYVEKLEKENRELRSKNSSNSSSLNHSDFSLSLKKNPILETEKKNFEEKLAQLDRLNDLYHQKHIQIVKVQESLRVRERWIEHKERELRIQWQKFEKTKLEWERGKTETVKEVRHMKLAHSYDINSLEALCKPEAPPPEPIIKRQESLRDLQAELIDVEKKLSGCENREESQKLVMKIDSLKNKIATARGQKALLDSNRSSRLISNMMRAMEKEVNYEENKRKQQLERVTGKKGARNSIDFGKETGKIETSPEKIEAKEPSDGAQIFSIKPPVSKLWDDGRVVDFRRQLLEKRERELHNRELLLQETWMKIPGSKELIEVVNLTLEKLREQKNELDMEREEFEKEKVEMFRIRDKLKDQVDRLNYNIRD